MRFAPIYCRKQPVSVGPRQPDAVISEEGRPPAPDGPAADALRMSDSKRKQNAASESLSAGRRRGRENPRPPHADPSLQRRAPPDQLWHSDSLLRRHVPCTPVFAALSLPFSGRQAGMTPSFN